MSLFFCALSEDHSAAPPEPQSSPQPPAAPPHREPTPPQPPPTPLTDEEALAAFPVNKLNKLDELINNPRCESIKNLLKGCLVFKLLTFLKGLMVQLQTFKTSDYLLKNNCFDSN